MLQHFSPSMRRTFMRELQAAGLGFDRPIDARVITDADLAPLPASVQRYLRYMGVVGRPRDGSLRMHFTGRFRLKPGRFMPCEAWQYNTRCGVTRIFHLRMRFGSVVPVLSRDTYRDG